MRFVVDEAGWCVNGLAPDDVVHVLETFLERLNVARERNEAVVCHSWLYEFEVKPGVEILSLLFEETDLGPGRDLRIRLQIALSVLPNWDENNHLERADVTINGSTFFAPSIAFAHARTKIGQATACLPLATVGRQGPVNVKCDGRKIPIYFVTNETEHLSFFRNVIEVENTNAREFKKLAPSAFPDLSWVDNVWGGLTNFSIPFRGIRRQLTQHLAVLNDFGKDVFRECQSTVPNQITPRFGAQGVSATEENGKVKRNKKAKSNRSRQFEGVEQVFWWHTKIHPTCDRIHFLYDEEHDRIVVGIFTEHCFIPGKKG